MLRNVRIVEGVVLGFLDIHKLRPRLEVIHANTALTELLTGKAHLSVDEVTSQSTLDQPALVGASILLPSKSKI